MNPEESAITNHENLWVSYVERAKETCPDIDFGSLDFDYEDLTEPQLLLDPEESILDEEWSVRTEFYSNTSDKDWIESIQTI